MNEKITVLQVNRAVFLVFVVVVVCFFLPDSMQSLLNIKLRNNATKKGADGCGCSQVWYLFQQGSALSIKCGSSDGENFVYIQTSLDRFWF